MMRRVLAVVALLGAAACMDWENDIPCRTERHCPSGYFCADGICQQGEVPDGGIQATDGGQG
ncbi:MAG: hypothetical protein AB2A00_40800 [Myxococcota bacterium]